MDLNKILPDHGKTLGQICNRLGEFAKKLYKFLHMLGSKYRLEQKSIVYMLRTLDRVGLGYISLGQPATTLSGGEAQRIKLAKELGKAQKSNSVYILDEPTTGLSSPDIEKLMLLLNELTVQGNTIIITEHDAAILSYCDWILEMGPGGGTDGGKLIAQGTPSDLKRNASSNIGPFLRVREEVMAAQSPKQ